MLITYESVCIEGRVIYTEKFEMQLETLEVDSGNS